MQIHLIFAICTLVSLGVVVDTTVKLFRFRRKNAQTLGKMAFRDFAILRRPNDFPVEETRLTYKNWLSSLATLVLIALLNRVPFRQGIFLDSYAVFGEFAVRRCDLAL